MLFASILFLFCHNYEIAWAAVAFGKAEQHQGTYIYIIYQLSFIDNIFKIKSTKNYKKM